MYAMTLNISQKANNITEFDVNEAVEEHEDHVLMPVTKAWALQM